MPQAPALARPAVHPHSDPNGLPSRTEVDSVNGVANPLIADMNFANGFPAFQFNGWQGVAPWIRVKPGRMDCHGRDQQPAGLWL